MSANQPSPDDAPLYFAREPIFPRRISGKFRSLKWVLMALMLGIYYILPWIRWDRGAALPDQAVLLDLANRRFFFFGLEIWPHEFYFVAGLLIMAGLGLFLFTSALGRVWCGYACPQTVWTDLYILVERWVEGDRNNRIRLHRQAWNAEKIRKRLIKWGLWLFIGLATGGAWVFYFTDAPTLLSDLLTGDASPIAYTTIAIATATTFAFGGFAREQMCIYACPWPRIQAAMMDEDTITIAYREWRGEPRGKLQKNEKLAEGQGDCIDCMACVNVCPMGIDIRNGQQLECITCGLCIDACNEMMDKIGKPRGLVGYMALKDETNERAGNKVTNIWKHVLRPRTLLYFTLWSGFGIALVVGLFLRSPLDFNVTPSRDPLFVTQSDGTIRNIYTLRIRNKHGSEETFRISATTADYEETQALKLTLEGVEGDTVTVPADQLYNQRLYLDAGPASDLAGAKRTEIMIWVEQVGEDEPVSDSADTVFNGKGK
ncbi:cytochrome c oxidase accessory protein CcoG [Rhodobacter capsulatus]|uniref:Cytochrome c oxidase, Cbb3-type, accessory protein CcoG n=1 Tax=Rhodobacter capsulatus (strain ATCC BAA-309 / NBRC 16581 / SB1003) TaxID=272942 RepID=D5ARP8_RHOCB|nr:cytochrome c oxidase accessory protein CcoG [Rhodobacter capsulatus]ADE84919.1 cytochrome c oxidase, Cbb3-type, accessory protein CcoG [Rhodobacter capsulatus SB 1003]ETD02358.1 protein rdxA [Rhodobacter capsulatus DE442]ETD77649.1 protein rdxA [Rhodobacter capsulatus R121]ETD81718.1 protein rdxA [Rhodobacter capsulatus YW1]ETD86839.1 protein rdxA [Rhodobacter capsulatus B6]